MIAISTLIEIVLGLIIIGGAIGAFYSLQTRQNMKISEIEEKVRDLRLELHEEKTRRTELTEAIVEMKADLKHILKSIDELKKEKAGP